MNGSMPRPDPSRPANGSASWAQRAERLLAGLVGAELAEAVLGDLQELRPAVEARWGKALSWLWFAVEMVRGTAALSGQRLSPSGWFRKEIRSMDNWSARIRLAAAVIGLVVCLPAAVLVIGGVLQSDWSSPALRSALEGTLFNPDLVGFRILIHPATVLSGLLLAAGLNLIPLLRVGLERRSGTLVGTLALRIRSVHLGVAIVALGLLGVILGYGFTENFRVVPTHSIGLESGWQYTAAPVSPVMSVENHALPGYGTSELGSRLITLQLMVEEGTWQALPTPPANDG